MSTILLREIVEESQKNGPPDLLPYPKQFAECLAEMTKKSNGSSERRDDRPNAFITTSGLRFVFSDPACQNCS